MKRALAAVGVAVVTASAASPAGANDVLARSRARYASLMAYADTGTVETESRMGTGPAVVERHTFTTLYRSPRLFRFDFAKDPKVVNESFVVWSDAEAFHTWWSTTGIASAYPKGTSSSAFALADFPTKGSVLQIAPLLYVRSGLRGALSNLAQGVDAGIEEVDGHPCYKVAGVTRDAYARTTRETRVRRTVVWIDAETLLVRRIVEETPKDTAAGAVVRVTTTFDPHADPELDEEWFRFAAPGAQD